MATHHPSAFSPECLHESLILRRGPDAHPDVGRQAASQRSNNDPFTGAMPPPLRTDLMTELSGAVYRVPWSAWLGEWLASPATS